MTKRKSKGAYMISAVAEMYEIHPQTLRLYEREGLLKPAAPKATPGSIPMKICSGWSSSCRWRAIWASTSAASPSFCKCASAWKKCSTRFRSSCSTSSRRCWRGPPPPPILPRARSYRCGGRWCRQWRGAAEGLREVTVFAPFKASSPLRTSLLPMEAVTAASIFCHLLGHFQESSSRVRQVDSCR